MIAIIIGVAAGAVLGFAWYAIIGCKGGSCPITSNPVASIIYGAVMGGLAGSLI